MLARTPLGVGAALDSDDARLDRLQPAPASKTSSTAEQIERSLAIFIRPSSEQAVIRCPSGGRDDLTIIRLDLAIYSCPSREKPQAATQNKQTDRAFALLQEKAR